MSRLSVRSALTASALFVCASLSMVCSPVRAPEAQKQPDVALSELSHKASPSQGGLVFPSEDPGTWEPREGLEGAPAAAELHVVEPSLDGEGSFSVEGQTVRVVFSEVVVAHEGWRILTQPPKDALVITPHVNGKVSWADDRTLQFHAAQPFDPDAKFEVKVDLGKTASGKKLGSPWRATFQATPQVTVAGKVINYLPKPGAPRVIAVHPSSDLVGTSPELAVVFDQAVDLNRARSLVTLTSDGKALGFGIRHPAGPSFQGIPLDPRFVVLARPWAALASRQEITLAATDGTTSPGPAHQRSYKVAPPLELTELRCEEYGTLHDGCDVKVDHVRTRGQEVNVVFNNPIGTPEKELLSHVSVTPWVRNLRVRHDFWDADHLSISGDLLPSTHYRVAIAGVRDVYGSSLRDPIRLTVDTAPLPASLSMPEGAVLLDTRATRTLPVSTRNVEEITLSAWEIPEGDTAAFHRAVTAARMHETPAGTPKRIVVPVALQRDALVKTNVDLSSKLDAGRMYVVSAETSKVMEGAPDSSYDQRAEASHAPVALVTISTGHTLLIHARAMSGATLVHVARLGSGAPVAGAKVEMGSSSAETDASGVALVRGERAADAVVSVTHGDDRAMLALSEGGVSAKDLFPELASDADPGSPSLRAVVLSDRGVYRPGGAVMVKGNLRRLEADKLLAVSGAHVRVRLVDPAGGDVYSEVLTTTDAGSVDGKIVLDGAAKVGRYRLRLENEGQKEPALAEAVVQVADFEPPRFKVDVEPAKGAREKHLDATVRARYLFGAPMDNARVAWTLRRKTAEFPHAALTDAGLVFRKRRFWYDESDGAAAWNRSGEGALGKDGTLTIASEIPLDDEEGPQSFTLEADVSDSSNRHVAGRVSVTKNPSSRYAGLRVDQSWVKAGTSVPVELGVIDTEGKSVVGVPVTARLSRLDWTFTSRKGPSGAVETHWVERTTDVGSCEATSAERGVTCSLGIPSSGDYQIRAEAFGKRGGAASVWAWGDGETQRSPFPTKGRSIELRTDKAQYKPGESAHVLARNPYPGATAILTLEQGGLVTYEAKKVSDPAVVFDVPVHTSSAPYLHAVVTLLPIGAAGEGATDSKIGAVRVVVAEQDLHLDVHVASDKPTYLPGEDAEIRIDVKDGKVADGTAEVALAVVDEGVLRLTSFHATDPTGAFRPGLPLFFRAFDTRQDLADWVTRSHVAGDGGGEEGAVSLVSTRRNFVETALWLPSLHVDAAGHAVAKLHLPDNLTEFRMMAVAIDHDGKAASSEASFTVRKPLMMVPVVPRFALVGDHFEAAGMLHNNTSADVDATVTLRSESTETHTADKPRTLHVKLAPEGHERVSFPIAADKAGERTLSFVIGAGGRDVDRVLAKVRVDEPGYDERPSTAGTFEGSEDIELKIPGDLSLSGDETVAVQMGENLWPELGTRLEYLLDYPHGCVEQTTSSTLPLLAARTILPRIGYQGLSAAELDKRIASGMTRLASMKTSTGGLAYWPGGTEPNIFGTAYAIRAVLRAKAAGIDLPPGLLEGMESYLSGVMLSSSLGAEVQAAIAESLADTGSLGVSTADALFDTRGRQSVFGLGSLALALHSLPGQDDRVNAVLDDIEASFGEDGALKRPAASDDFYYYGSNTRSRAQAAIALSTLRPQSRLAANLVEALASDVASYTTQATAWSLLAVATRLSGQPKVGASVTATLDGVPLAHWTELAFGGREIRIPVQSLVGRTAKLHLASAEAVPIGFMIKAHWKRKLSSPGAHLASHTKVGPDVYRVYTDPLGRPADMAKVHAGDVVRVLVVARLPGSNRMDGGRRGYVALTDRLAAGFEPIDPDLATVAHPPELDEAMPFADIFRMGNGSADHVELHDDRVQIYFDRPWGDYVTASYLIRATTPGTFALPPASGELMYEAGSEGYSDAGTVTVL